MSDDVIRQHLTGKDAQNNNATIGVYPLLPDERCWFLAADFDALMWAKSLIEIDKELRCFEPQQYGKAK